MDGTDSENNIPLMFDNQVPGDEIVNNYFLPNKETKNFN